MLAEARKREDGRAARAGPVPVCAGTHILFAYTH